MWSFKIVLKHLARIVIAVSLLCVAVAAWLAVQESPTQTYLRYNLPSLNQQKEYDDVFDCVANGAVRKFGVQALPAPCNLDNRTWHLAQQPLLRYSKYHALHKNRKDFSFLAWIFASERTGACGGISDRLRGIATTLIFAMLSGRIFLLDHDRPRGIEAELKPHAVDWTVETSIVGDRIPEPSQGMDITIPTAAMLSQLDPSVSVSAWWTNIRPLTSFTLEFFYKHCIRTANSGETSRLGTAAASLEASRTTGLHPEIRPECSSIFHSREEAEALLGMPQEMLQGLVFRYLYSIRPESKMDYLVDGLMHGVKQYNKPFVALHIRAGDAAMFGAAPDGSVLSAPDISAIRALAERCQGLSLLLLSDNPTMVAAVQRALPWYVRDITCCGRASHVDGLPSVDGSTFIASSAMREVLLAYELMGRAQAILTLGVSHDGGFAGVSRLWGLRKYVPLARSMKHAATIFEQLQCTLLSAPDEKRPL